MTLAAMHRPLGSMGRHLLTLCFTIIFALALDTGVALAIGGGHGGGGGGHGGGGFGGGGSFGGFGGGGSGGGGAGGSW